MDHSNHADERQNPAPQEQHTRWVLTSYRSLGPQGFLILMSILAVVSFGAGIAFLLMGAWPVFGFFGLDVVLIYLAFKLNYRSGRLYETVDLDPQRLLVTRHHPSGRTEQFEFNTYWARVLFSERADGHTYLALTSKGQVVPFAGFLTDEERREFAGVLGSALSQARAARV